MNMTDELLTAIELALENRWDEAHRIVQRHDGDSTAAWIHAVLHKIEGDLGNSRYWYRQARRLEYVDHDPTSELQEIKTTLAPSDDRP